MSKPALFSAELLPAECSTPTQTSFPTSQSMDGSSVSRYFCQIDHYLCNLFLQIGIPANKLGYRFLREAVHLVLQDPSLQNMLMRGLYPRIAERFHTSVYCVEHSMRCAITAAWSRGRPELVEKLLGRGVITAYDKPTNGEMIALVAEKVRMLLLEGQL